MWRINIVVLIVLLSLASSLVSATVEYDDKSFIINGKRKILISGSVHYPRSTPEMWSDLIQKAKDGGLDVIDTYVFWNGHEPSQGKYNFEGRYDVVKFVKLVQKAGLYLNLRIGPYVCAEWNFGGFPVWLKYVPGIEFRTDNQPFKMAMQGFVEKIANMMKSEKLFEPQGGPIIMSQIENEYGPVEWELGAPGRAYSAWAAKLAVRLNTNVPWIMCKHETAPAPMIDTCNGFYCENFRPNKSNSPKMFTEAWTGGSTLFGGPFLSRPAEDLAFAVARFVQNNGSYFNYYMYHGGTNFGRQSSARFIATSYDFDSPLDEYGLPHETKWGHLRDLHKAIKQCESALTTSYPTVTWPAKNQEVHVFKSKSGDCAAFLSNLDTKSPTKLTFQNVQYDLPPWSISILPDCKTEVFNTAKVKSIGSKRKMVPVGGTLSWQSYTEPIPSAYDKDTFEKKVCGNKFLSPETPQITYGTSLMNISSDEGFLKGGKRPHLTVMSAGHVLHVFVNGQLSGSAYGSMDNPELTYNGDLNLRAGVNKISLLSVAVGLPNVGVRNDVHFEKWKAGILGPVTLVGLNDGTRDLAKQKWSYKIGLKGESLNLGTLLGSSSVNESYLTQNRPLTWYKTTFNELEGNEPVAIDMSSMGKGEIWINDKSIGRHWAGYIAKGNCSDCNYAGEFDGNKCISGCGQPSQRWYHIPRSWLKPSGNSLVVFEEWGGEPNKISLVKRTV